MTRRLALAVGDTAGHVIPALAVAQAFASGPNPVDIHFVAAGEGTGHWLIERAGYPLHYVPGSPIARVGRLRQVAALALTGLGAVIAARVLLRHGVQLVIGTGGYGSAGAILAARACGLMTVLIEPNRDPGLANRLLARVAHRVCVAFPETCAAFPSARAVVTGAPLRAAPEHAPTHPPPSLPRLRVFVTSGSRGEQFLGIRVPELAHRLRQLGLAVEVRHQGGPETSPIQQRYDLLGIQATVEPFVENMAAALGWADVVIARAGAGTISEIAMAAVPSLLVPLPDAAHDHQAGNAEALVCRGAALSIRESDWDTHVLAGRLFALVSQVDAWRTMSSAVSALAIPDAASLVVRECEALMQGRW